MQKIRKVLLCSAGAVIVALPVQFLAVGSASAATQLQLLNGWQGGSFGTAIPSVGIANGIVTFKGAMSSGTSATAFVLPAQYRPAATVYVPVDMCGATKGRLIIPTSGVVTVQAETSFGNAQCFTSLAGVSYAKSGANFSNLALQNGWSNYGFGAANAQGRNIGGIVHLRGAVSTTGNSTVPFTLPAGLRPTNTVYVPVDMCNATNGRLIISPNGVTSVEAESSFNNAKCFTSLEGVTYAKSGSGFSNLALQNGWSNYGFGTGSAQVRNINGQIHLRGAIATAGSNSVAFTLPPTLRPQKNAYVHVDMCDATNGRLIVQPNGVVLVQAENSFSNAQCFTSLEGAVWAH